MSQKNRRSAHEGTLEKLPSGKFRVRGHVQGKEILGSACMTQKEAHNSYKSKRDVELERIARGLSKPMPTVFEYVEETLRGHYKQAALADMIAPKTFELYEQIWRINISDHRIADIFLDKLTSADIEDWMNGLCRLPRTLKNKTVKPGAPLMNSSKKRYVTFLQAVLERAVRDRIIDRNPAKYVKKPKEEPHDFITLDKSEQQCFLAYFPEGRLRIAALLGLHGLGPAEICGLRYEDFDGEGITLKRQVQNIRGGGLVVRDRLKTGNRKEWVPVDDALRKVLEQKKKDYVLSVEGGGPMSPDNLRDDFIALLKETEFSKMRPYDLRHTFAQDMLDRGVDIKTAAEMMRHSPEMFLNNYVRSDKNRKIDAMRKIDRLDQETNYPTNYPMGTQAA